MPRAGSTIIVSGRVQRKIRESTNATSYAVWDDTIGKGTKYVVWSRDELLPHTTVTIVGRPTAEIYTRHSGEQIASIVIRNARVIELISAADNADIPTAEDET